MQIHFILQVVFDDDTYQNIAQIKNANSENKLTKLGSIITEAIQAVMNPAQARLVAAA